MTANYLDIALLGAMGVSILLGAFLGLVRSALNLAAIAGAFIISYRYSQTIEPGLLAFFRNGPLAAALSYALMFAFALMIFGLLAALMRRLVRRAGFGGWDAAGGAVFGAARGFVIALAILIPLTFTAFSESATWRESSALPIFGAAMKIAIAQTPPNSPLRAWITFDGDSRPQVPAAEKSRAAEKSDGGIKSEEEIQNDLEQIFDRINGEQSSAQTQRQIPSAKIQQFGGVMVSIHSPAAQSGSGFNLSSAKMRRRLIQMGIMDEETSKRLDRHSRELADLDRQFKDPFGTRKQEKK